MIGAWRLNAADVLHRQSRRWGDDILYQVVLRLPVRREKHLLRTWVLLKLLLLVVGTNHGECGLVRDLRDLKILILLSENTVIFSISRL